MSLVVIHRTFTSSNYFKPNHFSTIIKYLVIVRGNRNADLLRQLSLCVAVYHGSS